MEWVRLSAPPVNFIDVVYVHALLSPEEELGEGLKVLRTYVPELCESRAQNGDVIHYHYVGRLDNGTEFGKRSAHSVLISIYSHNCLFIQSFNVKKCEEIVPWRIQRDFSLTFTEKYRFSLNILQKYRDCSSAYTNSAQLQT